MRKQPWYMQPAELKQELDHMTFCLGDRREAQARLRDAIGVGTKRFRQLMKPLEEVTP